MATVLTLPTRIRRLRDKRAVLRRLVRTNLSRKYEASTLGYLWTLLEPLMMTAVYFVVFGIILGRVRQVGPFAPFILSGVLSWQWSTSTFTGSMKALRGNSKMISKVGDLPREVYPLTLVFTRGADMLFSLIVMVPVALAFGLRPSVHMLLLPIAILMQAMLCVGMALGFSAGSTLVRDIERTTRPLIRAWFYLSPVLYPATLVFERGGPAIDLLYRLNPMTGILMLHRAAWSGWTNVNTGALAPQFESWLTVGVSAIGCFLVLAIGYMIFARLEPKVLKEI